MDKKDLSLELRAILGDLTAEEYLEESNKLIDHEKNRQMSERKRAWLAKRAHGPGPTDQTSAEPASEPPAPGRGSSA